MKILVLIIAVLFHVQPATAGACDMAGDNVPGGIADQPVEHPMEGEHDCCDEAPAAPQEGCDHGIECSTCTAGVLAVAVAPVPALSFISVRGWDETVRSDIPSQTFPLFKPPIS